MNQNEKRKKWLNSTVLGIGLASLFADTSHEMATAILPAFLTSIGLGSGALGIIEGVSDALASFSKIVSGHYTDHLERRKPLAVFGYILTALGMASFSFATAAWHVLLGRAFGWLGRGIRSPVRNTLLTEAVTPETYGRAFGLERAMDSIGAVIGPLLAIFLLSRIGFRTTFLVTLIPGLLAAICIGFLVKEHRHALKESRTIWKGFQLLPSRYKTFLVGVGIAGIGDFSNSLLILWATQAWTPQYGIVKAGALAMAFYTGFNVVYSLTCYFGGFFADLFPKQKVLAFGYVIAALPAVALILPGASFLKFAIVFGFSGLYMGIWETVETASAASLIPSDLRGIGFGSLATVNGIGDLLSSLIVGLLWSFFPKTAMIYVIITSLVGAFIVYSLKISED